MAISMNFVPHFVKDSEGQEEHFSSQGDLDFLVALFEVIWHKQTDTVFDGL